ncbi:MAG: hypothetical protein EXS36_12625 [Pedosphaera sp.]|nr:hypothetical protein [Pedosphaera sp.]
MPNDVNSIQLVDSVAYLAGSGELLGISTNGGGSWMRFLTDTTTTFNCLAFDSPTSGWAFGLAGATYRYNGVSWVAFDSGIVGDLYSVVSDYAGGYWAVGSGGILYRFNGLRWIPFPTGYNGSFHSVSFLKPNYGLASAREGRSGASLGPRGRP